MHSVLTCVVTAGDAGRALRDVVRVRLGISGGLLRIVREGGVTVNGQPQLLTYRVAQGDTVCAVCPHDGCLSPDIAPRAGALCVVYEDEDLMILNKPARLAVHPTAGHVDDTLANFVAAYALAQGNPFVFRPINRLDRNTSGLLCVAKHRFAAFRLTEQLKAGGMRRTYHAVLCGTGLPACGTVDAPIARCAEQSLARCVREDGDRAVTHFWREREANGYTLMRLQLETGRTHQIRVHMAYLGHPVVGDFLYGTELPGLEGHALHASRLTLTHPLSGRPLACEAPLPAPMCALLDK